MKAASKEHVLDLILGHLHLSRCAVIFQVVLSFLSVPEVEMDALTLSNAIRTMHVHGKSKHQL
jgi:hypothetical protein